MDVRWGFIGAGNVTIAKAAPIGAFTQEGSRVVAVARADAARAQAYADEHGIARAYTTAEEVCADPEVNAVFVCTPHHLHTEHVLAAIQAGKHVLCEKPLTITTEDGLRLVEAAQAAGVHLGVAYYRRFYPVLEMLQAVVEDGRLGALTTAQMVFRSYSIPQRPTGANATINRAWRTNNTEAGGGTLTDAGSHRVDLLLWLLGDAVSVSATSERFETWTDVEDQATVSVTFANRVSGHLDQSGCSRVPEDSIAIHGTHGTAFVPDLEGTTLIVKIGPGSEGTQTLEAAPRSQFSHRPLVTDFVQALKDDRPVRCTGADGLRATQLIELAYQSAREGSTLPVPSLTVARA